ncbi:MAG: glycosyltransferase family 39 protein, partial [Patescibacteria group bacterium]
MTTKQKFLLAGIVALAVFFRFYALTSMPGGLFPDEAANGLDINLMQEGQLQPFYERGNGREALFFYMLWGSVELFGKGHWQHHLVSAMVGVLSVIVCYAVARRLFSMDVFLRGSSSLDNHQKFGEVDPLVHRATNIALLSAFL